MRTVCLWVVSLVLALAGGRAAAEENAALLKYGATIFVTCKGKKPLNDKWAKPKDMLREKKPAAPIINDLKTGFIRIGFPLKLHVIRVGIMQGDYHGSFAKAKDAKIQAPGAEATAVVLENKPNEVQWTDYKAETDTIEVSLSSIYPGKNPKVGWGAIQQVQVIVSEDLTKLFAPPAGMPEGLPTFLMRTPNLDPHAAGAVQGQPRKATGHPCTIWDKQDIAEFKQQIQTYKAAKEAYDGIVAFCEKACEMKMQVPDDPDLGTNPGVAAQHRNIACGLGNLGIGYALSGNEKYAQEAKRLLLELAKRYEGWPVHAHPKFTHDKSKWSWQRLNDAIWLIPSAWGFDLIYESPSLTDADRKTIADHFVMPCVRQIMSSQSVIAAPTNWSTVCCAAVMVGSRVCGDQEFYEKSYMGLTRKLGDKKGGLFMHIDKGIDDDGMWAEGAIGYQFMAMRGLLVMAETLWHDGIDAYRYHNGRLKLVFDSPLWYCYPGGTSSPAIHDSGSASLFNRDSHLYQYAKRRYGDKTYNAILHKVTPTFESVYNLFLPACEFAPVKAADLPRVPSILFPGVGFAIARCGDGDESKYLLMDYGPNRSHGHPDKLNHCFYALGQELFGDSGSAWYSTDIYRRYYSTTLAHNTVSFNGMSQIMTGGELQAYSSCGPYAMMRASCGSAIPCTFLDRTLVLSEDRLYDIFWVRSSVPFVFELPYHGAGTMKQSVATEPWKEYPKDAKGYAYFKAPLAAATDADWQCTWAVKRGAVQMHAMGEPGTTVIFATTPKGGGDMPTAMLRRRTDNTVYATVSDVVAKGKAASLKGVKKIAAPDSKAYALLGDLSDGGQEVVLANFTGGSATVGDWTTDARVAFVQQRGGKLTAFTLAGGTQLTGPGVKITVSTPTLLVFRTVKDGLGLLVNQGDKRGAVTLSGLAPFTGALIVDRDGTAQAKKALPAGVPVALKLSSFGHEGIEEGYWRWELVRGEQPTVARYEESVRIAKIQAAMEAEAQARKALEAEMKAQYKAAEAEKVPADYFVLMQAEDFKDQGGGKVTITQKKAATFGSAFLNWDNRGHWLTYECAVAHEGYYQVVMKYCREGGPVIRSLQVDGKVPHEAALKMEMPGTGGWSNGADNWKWYIFQWPLLGKPFLVHLTAGKHVLRLENMSGGGLNMDYLLLVPAGVEPDRTKVER